MFQPFSRTPRPNIWMISGPSPTPTCINPMVLTRHEFQPAMKRRAPMTTFTVEFGRSTSAKSRAAKPISRSTSKSGLAFSVNSL